MTVDQAVRKIARLFSDQAGAVRLLRQHIENDNSVPGGSYIKSADGDETPLAEFLKLMEDAHAKRGGPLELVTLSCELESRGSHLFGAYPPETPANLDDLEHRLDPWSLGLYLLRY